MRVASLPSPGLLSNGIRTRIELAKAISAVEIQAGYNSGKASAAASLDAFLVACRTAIASFIETVVPTLASAAIGLSNTKRIVLTFSEGIDKRYVPAVTDFAIAGQVKAVTKVTIDGPFVYLDVATAFVAGAVTVAYTKPGTNQLRDLSGNEVASITATAVTNAVV